MSNLQKLIKRGKKILLFQKNILTLQYQKKGMRFLVLLLIINLQVFGQSEKSLLDYVNMYRVNNGLNEVTFDSTLHKVSEFCTNNMVNNDSLAHSNSDTYECIFKGIVLNPTQKDLDGFSNFIKEYFNIEYKEPMDSSEVMDYILMNIVYHWYKSPEHNKIMLKKGVKNGSTFVYIGSINKKVNYRVIGGKKVYFTKIISHWEVKHFATLNLK